MSARLKKEYGDFQTPEVLADEVVALLKYAGVSPDVIVEPTCGLGSFISAAMKGFHEARQVFAFDVNPHYVDATRKLHKSNCSRLKVEQVDFFDFDWKAFIGKLRGDILVIGNPPWVTNAALGAMGGNNLPQKNNFQNHVGFAAKTGKANFDISEWMLIRLLEAMNGRSGCMAILCKTATARKVLKHCWINLFDIGFASLHLIDTAAHFAAAVNACLFIVHTGVPCKSRSADLYADLGFNRKQSTFGLVGRELVADVAEYEMVKDIDGFSYYKWRSGIKHDAASVMELKKEDGKFINGFGECVEIEPTYLFPLLKSSDLANNRLLPNRFVIVTQRKPSGDTQDISKRAPRTWEYLLRHAAELDERRSIIYRKRARFAVFGVGDYTFSAWKVAISGLYKNCRFDVVGMYKNKPIVLDDTCYFVPCKSEQEANFICKLLNSELVMRFLHSIIFFDAKRPVTIDVLSRIDLKRVGEMLNFNKRERDYFRDAELIESNQPLLIYEKTPKYAAKTTLKRNVSGSAKKSGRCA
jgi:hypothetical protein